MAHRETHPGQQVGEGRPEVPEALWGVRWEGRKLKPKNLVGPLPSQETALQRPSFSCQRAQAGASPSG